MMSVLFSLTALCAYAAGEKMMSVQVKQGQIRSAPSFLGRIMVSLSYGDRVLMLEEKGSWIRVSVPHSGVEGWIHTSALTTKKIVIRAGTKDVSLAASSDELALAGKGFNKQVEQEFKVKNPRIDFTWVDRMEKIVVTPGQIQRFLKEGGLSAGGGDR